MHFPWRLGLQLTLALSATQLQAQAPGHIAAAESAQRRGAYAVDPIKGCPAVLADMFGWPKDEIIYCEYSKKDEELGRNRKALVYLLRVPPQTLASWIESACSQVVRSPSNCFADVLKKRLENSGYMFPIAGNIIEDMHRQNVYKNYFFRNGMTTSFQSGINDQGTELSVDDQQRLALMSDESALSIPTGLTRFWRTTPGQFYSRFPTEGQKPQLTTTAGRTAWLHQVRSEMLNALHTKRNRLLEAWLCANAAEALGRAELRCRSI